MPSRGINILRKITKVISCFILFVGVISVVLSTAKFITWQFEKGNYTEKYVYNMGGYVVYYEDDKVSYINDIVDVLGASKEINVPIGSLVTVYVDNSNVNSCIYFDKANTLDVFALNPASGIGDIYIFFVAFLGFIFASALKEEYVFIIPKSLKFFSNIIFLLGILLLVVGIREVGHIIGGLIIAVIGLHFAIMDDVVKEEKK